MARKAQVQQADGDDESEGAAAGRAIWSGSISFGLLQIPVKLYTAERRTEEIRFRQLDKNDRRREEAAPRHGEEGRVMAEDDGAPVTSRVFGTPQQSAHSGSASLIDVGSKLTRIHPHIFDAYLDGRLVAVLQLRGQAELRDSLAALSAEAAAAWVTT